jgi:hypothetical protein
MPWTTLTGAMLPLEETCKELHMHKEIDPNVVHRKMLF